MSGTVNARPVQSEKRQIIPAGVSLRDARQYLSAQSKKYPAHLVQVPREDWAESQRRGGVSQVWRSRYFVAQVFTEANGVRRISFNRAELKDAHQWKDGISWDELQQMKSEMGLGDAWAVEIFPPSDAVVNVANMRHLWVLAEPPPYGWNRLEPR